MDVTGDIPATSDILRIMQGIHINLLEIPSIFLEIDLLRKQHPMDPISPGNPMLRKVLLIHNNGAIRRTIKSLMCGCVLLNGL